MQLNSVTCVNIDFGTISNVIVQNVCAAKGLRTTNSPNCLHSKGIEDKKHFLLHCHRYGSPRRALLDHVSCSIDFDIKAFCSSDLCNLLLYGDSRLNLHITRISLESTLDFINQTKCFKKQVDEDSA